MRGRAFPQRAVECQRPRGRPSAPSSMPPCLPPPSLFLCGAAASPRLLAWKVFAHTALLPRLPSPVVPLPVRTPPPDPLHPKAHLRPHPRSLLPEATFGPLVREVGQTDCQPPPGRTATYDQQAGCCQRVQERLGHRAQAAAFRTHARLGWVGTGRVCPDTTRPLRRRHRRGLTPCWERPRPVFFVGPACDGGARWGTHPRACPCA